MNEEQNSSAPPAPPAPGTDGAVPAQDGVVGATVGATVKPKKPAHVAPLAPPAPVVVVQEETPAEEPISIVVNAAPLHSITKDTHTRMVQYLGIVNPGVQRIMGEMLMEQEKKVVALLASVGIKLEG